MVSLYNKVLGAVAAASVASAAAPALAAPPAAPTVASVNYGAINGGVKLSTTGVQQTNLTLNQPGSSAILANDLNVFNGVKASTFTGIQGNTQAGGGATLSNTFALPGAIKLSTVQLEQTNLTETVKGSSSASSNITNLGAIDRSNVTLIQGNTTTFTFGPK